MEKEIIKFSVRFMIQPADEIRSKSREIPFKITLSVLNTSVQFICYPAI